ncbi:MAG: cupin domain-containing protein [Cyanobacteria bacterium J06600_6]
MKKTFFTWIIIIFATFCLALPVNAASISTENIQVLHPQASNTLKIGKETFSYKILTGENALETMSTTQITQPSGSDGLLWNKHILQTPEEVYIAEGDFEFIFSQSNKKTQASPGDVVLIPAGTSFGFRHISKGQGTVVVVDRSSALPDTLVEIDNSENKNREPDIQTISSIANKYGIEFLN